MENGPAVTLAGMLTVPRPTSESRSRLVVGGKKEMIMQELCRLCRRSPHLHRQLRIPPFVQTRAPGRRGIQNLLRLGKWPLLTTSREMSSIKSGKSYEDAVNALNSLQSNTGYIIDRTQGKRLNGYVFTKRCTEKIGPGPDELSKLSVIHVTGTKGKGSTSAFCESILRHNGYKTGFFSSPHLVSVRERLRIDGKPISRQKFAKYFWQTYDALQDTEEFQTNMPPYFVFLTTMAFKVFLEEKVDVALFEVGIGGEYDSTNILQKVSVVGITSLGVEHTALLGNTLTSIAWQKAGIFKPSAVAFTVPGHSQEVLEVLHSRSVERMCPVEIIPSLDKYTWPDIHSKQAALSMFPTQKLNASLALQLANCWMKMKSKPKEGLSGHDKSVATSCIREALPFKISVKTAVGLLKCKWPGRLQILKSDCGRFTYFLDGAHTVESMAACFEWFKRNHPSRPNLHYALILNVIGDRDRESIIKPLLDFPFDKVFFSPNSTSSSQADNLNLRYSQDSMLKQTQGLHDLWVSMTQTKEVYNCRQPVPIKTSVTKCVNEALNELHRGNGEWCVLVTGSLHLVGAILSVIDPNLTKSETSSSEYKCELSM